MHHLCSNPIHYINYLLLLLTAHSGALGVGAVSNIPILDKALIGAIGATSSSHYVR